EYYGFRADERLRALSSSRASVVPARADLSNDPARLLENGEFENARKAAQLQLRSVTDLNRRKELLEIVRKAYQELAPYRFPSFQLATTGRTEFLIAPSKSE